MAVPQTWTAITLPSLSNSITYIAVKNDDPNTVWFTVRWLYSWAKVYESTDGGGAGQIFLPGYPIFQ